MDRCVFLELPEKFIPDINVVGCLCLYQERFLLLKRSLHCISGGEWCLPGGKLEKGESRVEGAKRELHEETGIELLPKNLSHFLTFYIQKEDYKYDFVVYQCTFRSKPPFKLNQEHSEGRWVTFDEAFALPLIHGGKQILDSCAQNL